MGLLKSREQLFEVQQLSLMSVIARDTIYSKKSQLLLFNFCPNVIMIMKHDY